MTERIIGLDSAVALAEVPVAPAPKKTERATITFCIDDRNGLHPVEVPKDFTIQDLKKATGSAYIAELQYDTVINRHLERKEGDIQAHHIYEISPFNKQKLEKFLDTCGLHR